MRVLVLERVLATAIVNGAHKYANLWLLPPPSMMGARIGIAAESDDDPFWWWFYRHKLGVKLRELGKVGPIGTVKLERVAAPGELGRVAFGPAVWVFSEPRIEPVEGKQFRAGYGQQPHVLERDRLKAGASPGSEGK